MRQHCLRSFKLDCRGLLSLFSLFLCLCSVLHAADVRAQTSEDIQSQLKNALDLYEKGRYIDALPIFQHLDEIHPNDPVIKAHLGFALVALAVAKSDPQERAQLRIRARKCLLDAQALGDKSNLVGVILDGLPEDGVVVPYSERKDIDNAMREGETAFAKGDMDGAVDAYQRALLLDPKQYYAALFVGDVHFRKKEVDQAGVWFARAITIDPDTETAYRYWGDALTQSQQYEEAAEKYIDAIVAQPYLRQSSAGLLQFAQLRHVTLIQPRIVSPDSHKSDNNQTNITIDATTLGKKDGTSNWMMYEMSRAKWRTEKFKAEYPDEKEYRHTLKEETEALDLLVTILEEQLKSKEIKGLDPSLATLLKLKQEGLIEAYILISAPDDGIAKDYAAYRAAHREIIHRYIAEYIAAPLEKTK
jgi:tetratricopeptide (TPR) repeat protein